ncbi:hypothetical protein FGK63_02635 [Ruegeria sediminis]|uniref:NrS-1 polymerase-like helicase domain-containing protein n=1 Tax=Ruegeria sediminis TaxID=2583820 RepID=A0ABY2X4U0_9RHOB|nr:primase-helicase family protein [Ruegeria sediminis]TMV09984.1 hypothetical protein FGK63_02635 [Ruegeria sediminis]
MNQEPSEILSENSNQPLHRSRPRRRRRRVDDQAVSDTNADLQISGTGEVSADPSEPVTVSEPEAGTDANDHVAFLSKQVSKWFVRSKNQFYLVEKITSPLTQTDAKRICVRRFTDNYPTVELTKDLLRSVFQRAFEEVHDDPSQSIPIWNGSTKCRPDTQGAIIPEGETVAINTWSKPAYRNLAVADADTTMFDNFLVRIFPHEVDRRVLKDWLAWCLQNEADKPAWAPFFYSRHKGTGKSTLCSLISKLFGAENSFTQNSVAKLTGKFNKPILDSKLVISEELQLKPDSPHGNTLKTYITEKVTVSEAKGREVEKVEQCCCFVFTTNHLPLWIEGDDRRYYVIDVDHSGHASGPDAENFGGFIAEFNAWMARPENIARLYNGLMAHQPSNQFNPRSLNLSLIETPVMRDIMEASREVLLVRLEEHINGLGRFALPQEKLAEIFIEVLKSNQNRIRHMMTELRWRSENVKWGGVDYGRTVWVHPDYQVAGGRVRGPDGYDQPIDPDEDEVEIIE